MIYKKVKKHQGYSLFELIIVIIILGIISSIAVKSLKNTVHSARIEETKIEMEILAYAIAGDPEMISGGNRTEYGYVGDNGSLPPNLDALVTNPGGFSTWNGPYIKDDFSTDGSDTEYKNDGAGQPYNYSGGNTIVSSGCGMTITRQIGNSTDDLLYNSVSAVITDLSNTPPGNTYKDSVRFELSYPNGSGSVSTTTKTPSADGFVNFDSIPIGIHSFMTIYIPSNDTLVRKVYVNPGQDYFADVRYFANVWSETGGAGSSGMETLRPSGSGYYTGLSSSGCMFNNWQCVDEEINDGSTSYLTKSGGGGGWSQDSYSTENHSIGSGSIDSVVIYMSCAGMPASQARTFLRTHNDNYDGSTEVPIIGSYNNYSTTYITNPYTSAPWTWTEIDDMEIGVRLNNGCMCTQVWAEVYYAG